MFPELFGYQKEAVDQMKNGSVLCGGVGSGKSITAIAYYISKVCGGNYENIKDGMKTPRDIFIITTAKKRDDKEWEMECMKFCIGLEDNPYYPVKVIVDSWNNIKKYRKVVGSFFIFDEQRVVGSGVWVKSFLDISRKNQWVLLSATPGDQWSDYIPVFIANGFYKNKTEFNTHHCIFSRFSKYPKIERYINERKLMAHRDSIVVMMKDNRETERHDINVIVSYDKELYRKVLRDRWDPYDNCPIRETGKLLYLLRKTVNSDPSRIAVLDDILGSKKYLIVFYNFDYELEILKNYLDSIFYTYSEWNGHKHQAVPKDPEGWVYLVQYAAGSEGWNCTKTDTIVFFTQNYSYRTLEQSRGRIDRVNTPFHDLFYYHIRSNAPIDLAIHQALARKKKFNDHAFIRRFIE